MNSVRTNRQNFRNNIALCVTSHGDVRQKYVTKVDDRMIAA